MARGAAGQGKCEAGQGLAGQVQGEDRGQARLGRAWLGMAGQGGARRVHGEDRGMARHGATGQVQGKDKQPFIKNIYQKGGVIWTSTA